MFNRALGSTRRFVALAAVAFLLCSCSAFAVDELTDVKKELAATKVKLQEALDREKAANTKANTAIDNANATIKNANATIDNANATIKNANATIDNANAKIKDADASMKNARAIIDAADEKAKGASSPASPATALAKDSPASSTGAQTDVTKKVDRLGDLPNWKPKNSAELTGLINDLTKRQDALLDEDKRLRGVLGDKEDAMRAAMDELAKALPGASKDAVGKAFAQLAQKDQTKVTLTIDENISKNFNQAIKEAQQAALDYLENSKKLSDVVNQRSFLCMISGVNDRLLRYQNDTMDDIKSRK
jgi:DNA repair exonuclease SbcCD ATPase subunit